MNIFTGFLSAFFIVHVIVGITTNYTTFYWIGKFFVEAEAIQNSAIHSVPAWVRSWKGHYLDERSHLKGIVNV